MVFSNRSTRAAAIRLILFLVVLTTFVVSAKEFSYERIAFYRSRVKDMFYHAYNGYLDYAYPLDELKPLTCQGMDTWGSFSLTLVDALDTLIIMGNYTEFARASALVLNSIDFDANINVSVFETNIRIVGGLLSAHMLSGLAAQEAPDVVELEPGWPCSGPLLTLAERMAQKLLPAFNSMTGMPYGTANLKYGVHNKETPITCTAGVGTFLLEFTSLSRLTGNPHYERIAMKAMKELWRRKSPIGLVGNHINVQTGSWTATDMGIGAGVDSYFEYLVKAAVMFQKPDLMRQFAVYQKAIEKYVRQEDWFMWVSMTKGSVSMPVFQSLEAFWPGVLSMIGEVDDAMRIVLTYQQVLKQYGFVPEFFNIPNLEAVSKRSGYPLRPELIESVMYLYRATKDPQLLQIGVDMIEAIDYSTKTPCGYATVHNVKDHTLEDRMESFFLSETTKYLYLLFDPENFIHNEGDEGLLVETTSGTCVVNAGGYVFNTEAHPLDPAITYCCSERRQKEVDLIRNFEQNIDFLELLGLEDDDYANSEEFDLQDADLPDEVQQLKYPNNNRSEMVIELPQNHGRIEKEEEDVQEKTLLDEVVDYETEEIRKKKAAERSSSRTPDNNNDIVPGEVEDESETVQRDRRSINDIRNKDSVDGSSSGSLGVDAAEIPHFGAKKQDGGRQGKEPGQVQDEQKPFEHSSVDHGSKLLASTREKESTLTAGKKPALTLHGVKFFPDQNAASTAKTRKDIHPTGSNSETDQTLKRTVEQLLATQATLGLNKGVTKELKKGSSGTVAKGAATNSQLADSIVKAFEYLMKDWKDLMRVSTTLEDLKKMESEFPCDPEEDEECLENSCRFVDENTGNRALNKLLNIMYQKQKRKFKKPIIVGPYCRLKDAPKESDNYNSNIPEDIALGGVEAGEGEIENASVPKIDIGRFDYRRLGQMNFDLMSCPSRPFLAKFTGLGQVMTPKNF